MEIKRRFEDVLSVMYTVYRRELNEAHTQMDCSLCVHHASLENEFEPDQPDIVKTSSRPKRKSQPAPNDRNTSTLQLFYGKHDTTSLR